MSEATLLVELLTEELPPKSLLRLSEAFGNSLFNDLKNDGFVGESSAMRVFATPRRLAISVSNVRDVAPDKEVLVKGPAVKSGLDAGGKPAPALIGFARKRGVAVDQLIRINDGKQDVFAHRDLAKGGNLETNLELKVSEALSDLPIPKTMHWGASETQFVRPVHGLMMLHGKTVVPGEVLGLKSGNRTKGHRFMSKGEIVLASADEYEPRLLEGSVVASFEKRKADIEKQLQAKAKEQAASLGEYQALLDEVTALVEHPSVYVGEFDNAFLSVPQECLILTMRQNQKYFPLFDGAGKLTGKFLIVSNMQVADPTHIIGGNQRVVRPRLEDARFFFDQDRKKTLGDQVQRLAAVTYHNKLGSQLERVERLRAVAAYIAKRIGAEPSTATRAAWLSKGDLVTSMVAEFPELQGTMGRYYALHDGEPNEVAAAVEQHYWPRFSGDRLPTDSIAQAVALADKVLTLTSLARIGERPTGDKDQFGFRRAALGIARILIELKLPLDLREALEFATRTLADDSYSNSTGEFLKQQWEQRTKTERGIKMFGFAAVTLPYDPATVGFVFGYILERLRPYFSERGYEPSEIEAVLASTASRLDSLESKLDAVKAFKALPEADSLAAANKRVLNIIFKNEEIRHKFVEPKRELMTERAEIALMATVDRLTPVVNRHYEAGEYKESLRVLAQIKPDVDRFFDEVMVMVDDQALRNNRAALLQKLGLLMNRVADISKLAT